MDAQEMFATVLEEYLKHKYPSQPLMFAKTLQRLADIRELQVLECIFKIRIYTQRK